jgi:acetyl esterase
MKNKLILIQIIISLGLGILRAEYAGGEDPTPNAPPDSVIYKHTPQGDLKLYFHYPGDRNPYDRKPVIVFFFGGGWAGGNIGQFLPQAEYLLSRGMIAVRADYRVRNRHGTTPDICVEDGKSAVRWIRQNAALIGGDPDRIVASGGSAGGHVAVCTYVVEGLEAEGEDLSISSRPNLLILFNPVMDLTGELIRSRFGSEEMALRISPNQHLSASVPPMIMFFGSDDPLIEPAFQTLNRCRDLGLDARLWIAYGVSHGFFNRSPLLESTISLSDKFLVEMGYLKGKPTIKVPPGGKMKLYTLPNH